MTHELYDGNQLPENPTSNLQLAVSVVYTLMMTFYMSLGGLAAWAAQKHLTLSPFDKGETDFKCSPAGLLQHPAHYMSDLLHKRNAICAGILAFIPAAYSLAHLYTSSLHRSSLYTAGNVIFAALMGYSAFFMGKTLQTLVAESDRMDTTKAVYESLYMLASAYGRLERCKQKQTSGNNSDQFEHNPKQLQAAWRNPWVLFHVFLAIAVQDDSRIWCMFTAWLRKFRESALTVWVPRYPSLWYEIWDWWNPAWFEALSECKSLDCKQMKEIENRIRNPQAYNNPAPAAQKPPAAQKQKEYSQQEQQRLTNVAYGYWLHSQNKSIRTITGSMVVHQGIHDELQLASYRSRELYSAAAAYIGTLTEDVVHGLKGGLTRMGNNRLIFYTETGKELPYEQLVTCCQRIFHRDQAQALGMVCERYICRLTPAFASLCLPTNTLVPRLLDCWKKLFVGGPAQDLLSKDGGYWCHLWLAYMHVVLLAVDLLRMHNNKPYFKDVICEAGALNILATADKVNANASTSAAAISGLSKSKELQGDDSLELKCFHDMSDADLYALAAYVATILLKVKKLQEPLQGQKTADQQPAPLELITVADEAGTKIAKVQLSGSSIDADFEQLLDAGYRYTFSGDYLLTRSELINRHISLPCIVQGIEGTAAPDWVLQSMMYLSVWIFAAGLTAAVVSTIGCSQGVYLVAIAGAVQAFGAWAQLLHMDQLPDRPPRADTLQGPQIVVIRMLRWLALCFCWAVSEVMARPVWLMFLGLGTLLSVPNSAYVKVSCAAWRWKNDIKADADKNSLPCAGFCCVAIADSSTASMGPPQGRKQGVLCVWKVIQRIVISMSWIVVWFWQLPMLVCRWLWQQACRLWTVYWLDQCPLEPPAAEQAAELLAAFVAVAATAEQAVNAADLCTLDASKRQQSGEVTPLEYKVDDWKAETSRYQEVVDSMFEATVLVENQASADSASSWHNAAGGAAAAAALAGGQKCRKDRYAVNPRISPKHKQPAGASVQRLQECWSLLHAIKFRSILLMLHLFNWHRISLCSCLERSRRNFYRERISPLDVLIKASVPLFFYLFILSIVLVIWQEPWYTRTGMCYSRCYNSSDCQAQNTLGLVNADNSLGRLVSIREALAGMHNKTPACPGAGALVIPGLTDTDSCGCPWLAQVLNVTVLQPVQHSVSQNTTLCTAKVRLVDSSTRLPPSIGTAVPAVWQSMTNGENDDESPQAEARVTGFTNSTGYANLTTPLGKPFNRSSGHGCNVTILVENITSYVINQRGSVLHNHIGWGCIDCKGEWVLASECDALCESVGNRTHTYHFLVPQNDCGAACPAHEGQNMTELCHNYTFCGCTGDWWPSKECDAPCESWGKRTMTYHVFKPAMARWVDGRLVPGAPCPAQDLQTREEDCQNKAKCVTPLHADVYSQSGMEVHGDLVLAGHGRP